MDTKEIWACYVPDATPGELMCRFELRNSARCVDRYLEQLGSFYGVVRRGSWRDTFAAARQLTRETVRTALVAHLEETRPEWDAALDRYLREQETARRKEAEAREAAEQVARATQAAQAAAAAAQAAQAVESPVPMAGEVQGDAALEVEEQA